VSGRANTRGVVDVLEANRDTVQRPLWAIAHNALFRSARVRHRALFCHEQKTVQTRIDACDAIKTGARKFDR
jgi:hypothetical protein